VLGVFLARWFVPSTKNSLGANGMLFNIPVQAEK